MISSLFQEFIKACLQYNKDLRPDALQLANFDYLKPAHMRGKKNINFDWLRAAVTKLLQNFQQDSRQKPPNNQFDGWRTLNFGKSVVKPFCTIADGECFNQEG